MDDTLAMIVPRFAERLLAVGFGGLAIYFGYRLFLSVPEAKDGEGRFTLSKDLTVVISRVGPGVFFALFGAIVVGLSLVKPVSIERGAITGGPAITFSGVGTSAEASEEDARRDKRLELRREIAVLNELPVQLDPALPESERHRIGRALANTKLELMKPVWGKPDAGWGTPAAFEAWLTTGPADQPPVAIAEAVKYFNYSGVSE